MRPVPLLLLVLALCVLPLALGAEAILLFGLPGGLPLGTLLAALAFVLGAVVSVAASQPRSLLRRVSVVALAAAALWLPIGVYLAENAALRFVNDAADSAVFWRLTAGLGGLILTTMLWAGTAAFLARRRADIPNAA